MHRVLERAGTLQGRVWRQDGIRRVCSPVEYLGTGDYTAKDETKVSTFSFNFQQ